VTAAAPAGGRWELAACPRLRKLRFASQEAAQAWLDVRPRLRRQGNKTYRCPGGHWHCGRPGPRGRQRLKGRAVA
jgi:hypothetical protein